jgi:glycosyltransferase involved in cell wall biosynthesis
LAPGYRSQAIKSNSEDQGLVSVIIPNYNQAQYVRDAIQSVLDQTLRSFEIVVVDDGSTDNSREVVAAFGSQVRYIWQENQGLAGARNTGIRAARGEFIGLLDADDQWLPTFLEIMFALTDQHPEAAVYYCCARGMDVDGHDLPQIFGGPDRPPDTMYQTLLRANFLIPSTIVMRRSIVMDAGLFDQRLRSCEDWDLWLRMLPEHLFVGMSACLVRYRLHGSSLSTNLSGMQQAAQAVIEKHFGVDDGCRASWSHDKRRAYGGLYRYHLLTSVQRRDDWQAATSYLRRALQADPTLATDLALFYDLALGTQPPGYRGTAHHLNLENNATNIGNMLSQIFGSPKVAEMASLRHQTYGTAYYALGLVAYNTGYLALSRQFLLTAMRFRSELWRDTLVLGNLVKSFVGRSGLDRLRMLRSVPPRLGSV